MMNPDDLTELTNEIEDFACQQSKRQERRRFIDQMRRSIEHRVAILQANPCLLQFAARELYAIELISGILHLLEKDVDHDEFLMQACLATAVSLASNGKLDPEGIKILNS